MPYKLGTRGEWTQREVFETLHHAVSNATGTVLYVYGARGRLLLAHDCREIIEQHVSYHQLGVNWNIKLSDELLAKYLTDNEAIPLRPLVKQLKALVRKIGR